MIVRTAAEGMLIVRLLHLETNLLENAAIHEQRKRPVDGGLAYVMPALPEEGEDLLGLEVPLQFKNGVENLVSGDGVFDAVSFQIVVERLPQILGLMQVV